MIDVDSIFFETKNVRPSGLSGCRWRRNGFNHQHMKKRVITLGVAALGVAGAQAADGKLWEVSASLKGFYDDNYTTSPDDLAEESWGIEVSPGLSLSYGQGTDLERPDDRDEEEGEAVRDHDGEVIDGQRRPHDQQQLA